MESEVIPTEIIVDQPVEYKHNWLYSVLPIQTTGGGRSYLFLSGYCRACNNAFSVQIPNDYNGKLLVTPMNVPKYGCVGS